MASEEDVLHCGITLASKYLNLSVTTVDRLVEQKILQAWYTDGGHRRITMESIDIYLQNRKTSLNNSAAINSQRKILIFRDENNTATMYAPSFRPRRINI